MALFANTSKDSFAVRENFNLTDIISCITSVLLVQGVPDLSVLTRHNTAALGAWKKGHTENRNALVNLKIKLLISATTSALVLKIVYRAETLVASVCKARVIIEPVNVGDFAIMALADLVGRAIYGVEVVDVSVRYSVCCEHVTAVTESNYAAMLERD